MRSPRSEKRDGHYYVELMRDPDMEKIQTLLRQTRENKGVSLEEVEAETRIPRYYLEMLEGGGDSRLLADQMYLIPALRTYAIFLGINPATAVAQFVTELQGMEAKTSRSERTPEPSALRPSPSRFLSRAVFFVIFIGILSLVWQYSEIESWWQSQVEDNSSSISLTPPADSPTSPALWTEPVASPSSPPSLPSKTETTETALVSPAVPLPSVSAPQAEPSAESAPPSQPPAIEAPHVLRVQAKERTWMRVTIDDQGYKDFLLQPGQEVEWTAQDGFTLTVGNAGGVQLSLDGQLLPPLGKSGQVLRNIQLPPRG